MPVLRLKFFVRSFVRSLRGHQHFSCLEIVRAKCVYFFGSIVHFCLVRKYFICSYGCKKVNDQILEAAEGHFLSTLKWSKVPKDSSEFDDSVCVLIVMT